VTVGLTVLGATGSIGCNTLDVVRRHPDRFHIVALTAHRDLEGLYRQCLEFRPRYTVLADEERGAELALRLRTELPETEVLTGTGGLEVVAGIPEASFVMAAIVGAAGLLPALAAVRAGKRLLLANKEALVMAGALFMDEAAQHGAEILPIDSEHNAVFQCLPAGFRGRVTEAGVRRILLTASGGPFRSTPLSELERVTPEQACSHPRWKMGRKISVDSATMMNKGLEVIEACWLFGASPDEIQVVLHPQSVIHSLVEYTDGSLLAQLGNPDMRIPIAHALAWPERIESGVASLDLAAVARLDFEPPDLERFRCLDLAYRCAREGGSAPAVLNAANEVAVGAFLEGRMRFTSIPAVIEDTIEKMPAVATATLEGLLEIDRSARAVAEQAVARRV
jgi:1-deoxy-D-xylulose-5-phosphate reductoisomerase